MQGQSTVMWNWLKKLFTPTGQIPPAVNRKDRRTRQAIARKVRLHKTIDDDSKVQDG